MISIKELTGKNRKDAEIVIKARFPASALKVLDKVMSNPLEDEHKGYGDILYVDEKPVAFRAALRRKLFVGSRGILARVRGLTCRLVDSPKNSISRLVEAQKSNARGCLLAISNTQCVPTERRAVQNGATLGPDTCKRYIWRAIRPLDCLIYFIRRKVFRLMPEDSKSYAQRSFVDFEVQQDGLCVKRINLDDFAIFDRLMSRYLASNKGFVSSRTTEEMSWIYGDGVRSGRIVVLCAEDKEGPVGCLVLKSNKTGVRWLLGDLLAVENRMDVMCALLKVACGFLRRYTPAMMLESIGFPVSVDSFFREFMPHERKCAANFDSFNFFSESDTAAYRDLLLSDQSWFFGPYDGDMCLDE